MAMDLWRLRPYTVGSLAESVDRLFERAFGPAYTGMNGGSTGGASTDFRSLPVNVWETDEAYQAAFLAPGLNEQALNVTVHEDVLTIDGELHFQVPEGARPVWQEFGPAKFRRQLRLNAGVDAGRVEALYRNGLLLVTLPKAEHARPRQIPVRVASQPTPAETPGTSA